MEVMIAEITALNNYGYSTNKTAISISSCQRKRWFLAYSLQKPEICNVKVILQSMRHENVKIILKSMYHRVHYLWKKVTVLLGSVLDNISEYCLSKNNTALKVKMFSSGITEHILEESNWMLPDKTDALIIHARPNCLP